jgi:hypothetical protein
VGIGKNVLTRALPVVVAELATSIALERYARGGGAGELDRAEILADVLEQLGVPSHSSDGSDKPASWPAELVERAERIRAAGGTPKFYRCRHGSYAVMDTAAIGRGRKKERMA